MKTTKTAKNTEHPATARLRARKAPSQTRSLQTVRRIIDAARRLLKRSNSGELTRITTNHIAKEAGVSVGSLYQYFPNTESVLYELYQEMLEEFREMLKSFDSRLSLPRDEFLAELSNKLANAAPDKEIVFAMRTAINLYPALAAADRRNAEQTISRLAGYLKHYGSKWPAAKLERLATFTYYVDWGIWAYCDHVRPANREAVEWERETLLVAFRRCFE